MKTDYLILFITLFVVLISAVTIGATEYPSNGVINWKGQTWDVRSGTGQPGNNCWNNEGVWVDDKNRMHLTIVNDNGKWKCTEIDSRNKFLYGTFTWKVASPVFTYDKNSVVGLFTYLDDSQELDIEMARWGQSNGSQLWNAVQPYNISGNSKGVMIPSCITGTNTIHQIDWQPTYVRFTSSTTDGKILSEFNYTNVNGIPKNPEYVIMNLWLQGAPSDGKNIELIISDFSYTPYKQ
ncbi:glycoside hydrolase family 16 protein [Methanosarcina sp. 1.H.A.2.2]|uniref:glycoside hydrolase family 16 protein n=1 Tax=Methanosarcina sp. 1.H.A.2.2 TaxID=1483601 RepID=UPI000621F4DE|nr:glycoside hydrolase family 16 protein [Methanosarcina sp. 1.H.A.2.2]KKH50866.1 hypothetical protein EO93_09170 [Methanosarcina sp. 1.H.A.2.2]